MFWLREAVNVERSGYVCPFLKYGVCIVAPDGYEKAVVSRARCMSLQYRTCKLYVKNAHRLEQNRTEPRKITLEDYVKPREHEIVILPIIRNRRSVSSKIEQVIEMFRSEGKLNI